MSGWRLEQFGDAYKNRCESHLITHYKYRWHYKHQSELEVYDGNSLMSNNEWPGLKLFNMLLDQVASVTEQKNNSQLISSTSSKPTVLLTVKVYYQQDKVDIHKG